MSIVEQHTVPAAWYPDQNVPDQLRWWDGSDWTSDVRPLVVTITGSAPANAEVPAASTPAGASETAPTNTLLPETPLLETRRGLHAVAKPAQGFGQATAQQLRSWEPPKSHQRSDVDVPVREMPREWASNGSVDAIKGWIAKSTEPVQFVPKLAHTLDALPTHVEELTYPAAVAEDHTTEQPDGFFFETPPLEMPVAQAPLVAVPDLQPAPTLQSQGIPLAATPVALSRRQLREMLGGPLTSGAEAL